MGYRKQHRYRALVGDLTALNEAYDRDGLHVWIDDIERTRLVVPESVQISNVLTRKVDTATLEIRKFGDRTFAPTVGQQIIIKNGGERIFGGRVTRVQEVYKELDYVSFLLDCVDFTRDLDHNLVIEAYQGQTVNEIIAHIKDNYLPANIKIGGVSCSETIDYIAFNYEQVSSCLTQLAEQTGYDWYVDYFGVIQFFLPSNNLAPFELSDTTGRYIYESLRIQKDINTVKNSVIVRGGEYLGSVLTVAIEADGVARIFPTSYKFSDLQVSVTGQIKSIGIDFIDAEENFDLLYNFNEKLIKFRAARKPTATSEIRISGNPWLPVIVKVQDRGSIGTFAAIENGEGTYEYKVIDKSIKTKAGARDRAAAELLSYAATLVEGEFDTYDDGLHAGQYIRVQSDLRGLDESYVINRVDIRVVKSTVGEAVLLYHVSMVSTRQFDHIDFLRKLVTKENKEIQIQENEVLDEINDTSDSMSLADTLTSYLSHNPLAEALTMTMTSYLQPFNYDTTFVVGDWTPTVSQNGADTKRVFILDGSPLG